MKKSIKISILILCVGGLFSSCGPHYYIPTQQIVPTFKEQGDIQASGTVSVQGFTGGSVAGAVSDNLSVQLNGVTANNNRVYNVEGAMGYYNNFHKRLNFNCYLGYGQGLVKNDPNTFRMSFQRLFVQPSFAYTSKYFEAIFSLKASGLNYDVDVLGDYNTDYHSNLPSYDGSNYVVLEPGITLRAGFSFLKLQLQTTSSNEITNQVFEMYEGDYNLGLVFQYPLSKLYD